MWSRFVCLGVAIYSCLIGCQHAVQVASSNPNVAGDASALIRAAANRDEATVQKELDNHIDVNAQDGEGKTALHWASELNDVNLVRILLKAGANPNIKDRFSNTPLTLAADKYQRDI